jgi:quercetin dioxygenase-like cupin family protein
MRRVLLYSAVIAAACGATTAAAVEQAQSVSEPPKIVNTPIVRTGRTTSNQPLKLPQTDAEVVAVAVDIPPGGATPIHQHPWSRFVYVERGLLRVVNHDTGQTHDFKSGTLLPEVVAQWHEGRALTEPVRLIVIDLVPRGETNMVMKPDQKM